jgi:MFS family permease
VWWTINNVWPIDRNSTHGAPVTVTVREVARARGWGFVLASTGIGSFVTSANLSTVNVAFPDLRASFAGESLANLGWVINAYTIAFAAILLPAGRLADSHGRRRMFFAGLTLFALGSLVTGAAPTLEVVVLGRTIQGMGSALIAPASLGLLLEVHHPMRSPDRLHCAAASRPSVSLPDRRSGHSSSTRPDGGGRSF